MEFFQAIIGSGKPLQLTADLGLVAFGLLAGFFYAMSLGRRRLILTLLSIYCSVVVFRSVLLIIPNTFFQEVAPSAALIFSFGGFIGIIALVYVLISGSALRLSIGLPRRGDAPWWHMILLSIVTSGFFVAALVNLVPSSFTFSSVVHKFFFEYTAFLWWSIIPLVALAAVRKKSSAVSKKIE